MAKRFFNPDWKQLRKLSEDLQRCYFYCWHKADNIGVYEFDAIYLKADLKNVNVSFEDLLTLPFAVKISPDKFIFLDFIEVNYGVLKENYNPHKPAFRDLKKHTLILNSSLNQACVKLEDEEEDEEESFGKSENLLPVAEEKYLVPEIMKLWKSKNKNYPEQKQSDYTALREIAQFISDNEKVDCDIGGLQPHFDRLFAFIREDNFWKAKSLKTISNSIQTIWQESKHGNSNSKKGTSVARIDALRNWGT
jgi:hypothetical protein